MLNGLTQAVGDVYMSIYGNVIYIDPLYIAVIAVSKDIVNVC